MKFLCPSCKAKYQIADEKVAGRSVRMKCRKCGYIIQVSSISGLGDALPGSEPPSAIGIPSEATAAAPGITPDSDPKASSAPLSLLPEPPLAPAPSSPALPKVSVPRAAITRVSRPGELKPPLTPARPTPSVVRPAASPGAKAPLAAPRAPSTLVRPPTPAPKASPAKSSPLQPAPAVSGAASKPGFTVPLPAVAPKPNAPVAAPVTSAAASAANQLPDTSEEEESTRIADAGALAGAFSLAVGAAAAAAAAAPADPASMPADEWFVGINGVPVGPIRLSELRSKAAAGSISRESLVWRDGFEDWRPLRTFPELLAIVDEGLSSMRASLTPFTPPIAMALGLAAAATAPDVTSPLPAVGTITPDPFAGSPPSGVTGVTGVTGAAVVTDELDVAGVPKRGGSPYAAWLAVAMALLFGLTIGFVLFKSQTPSKTIEVVKYVDRPVPSAASAAAHDDKVTELDETAVGDGKNAAKHLASSAAKGASAPSTSAESDKGLKGLQGLQGLGSGPKGPEASGPSGAVQGTGQLDGSQIQSTVARYTGSVKRACWQPALDTRDKDAPTTARVNVAITVMPSGSVSNAAVGADPKGYRGLSQCISSRVRGWQFPPSGDSTTVNVPFVFAAQ